MEINKQKPAPTVGDEHVKKGDDNTVRENVREETPPDWGGQFR